MHASLNAAPSSVDNNMPYFTDTKQFYTVMQTLFIRMSDLSPNPVDALVSSHMIIRISLTDLDANITINGRKRPVTINYGSHNGRADIEIGMTAETLHLILLDEYSIKQGLSNGELIVRGPAWKALAFADIFKKGRALYPQVLQEQGFG
jgi:hypothetical protein